ncbi:hypothetical protein K457DRAFT_880196 [Linnemannia elongata AG-77]|uniref:Uncharacterized protein n=1 Tax=Linnemannia elongata AG-77 TaxID=1314771 RepID=A0A197JFE4_9FUNG|nr:hypothetical protein K457DRAFT_880196 [Linnemannia elongata AG-77]
MKRNSTQHSTSGTPPISFAAAAQKNTNKANPPTQPATTTTPATPAANPSSAAAAAPAAASQTPSSTATTPSSGSQAAAVNNSSSSTSTTPSSKPTSAKPATSTPTTPSTANGNYSAVAAKANHAANRRSQAPTAAAAVKSQPAAAKPAATPAASVQFGSINDSTSGSAPAASSDETPAATATEDAMTFGSITATKKISSNKPEEATAAPAPEPTQPVPAESHHNTFKPTSAHGSQNQHRRTDSTNSAHATEHHYRAQVPPTISQAPMMPSMGVPQAGATGFTSQQPPIKNMRPMNPATGHHMHPQHPQQWGHNQGYYMPTYDQSGYYQQHMYPQAMPAYSAPPRQPIATRQTFNTSAPAFTPQAQGSKRIAIINPETKAEVKPEATSSPSLDSKTAKTNVADVKAATEEEKKSIITPPPVKNVIKIVNPAEKEREEREQGALGA